MQHSLGNLTLISVIVCRISHRHTDRWGKIISGTAFGLVERNTRDEKFTSVGPKDDGQF